MLHTRSSVKTEDGAQADSTTSQLERRSIESGIRSRFVTRSLTELDEGRIEQCAVHQGRSFTRRSSSVTTAAIRCARSAGLRFVASIHRR